MCMMAVAVTKDYGVMAVDSARYSIENETSNFDAQKLFHTKRYLMTFIGTPLYLAKVDFTKFSLPLDGLSLYLRDYMKEMKPKVEEMMKSEIADKDDQQPNVCLYVLGMHKKVPTLAQFNSFNDFEPKYLWTRDNDVKFSTIYFGGEDKEKGAIFTEATAYMEKKAKRYTVYEPGILGEILTRGIYKKADLEEKLKGHKYAGGVVNVAYVRTEGLFSLSGLHNVPV